MTAHVIQAKTVPIIGMLLAYGADMAAKLAKSENPICRELGRRLDKIAGKHGQFESGVEAAGFAVELLDAAEILGAARKSETSGVIALLAESLGVLYTRLDLMAKDPEFDPDAMRKAFFEFRTVRLDEPQDLFRHIAAHPDMAKRIADTYALGGFSRSSPVHRIDARAA